ncbi:MAG: ABC transporter permease [Alistipes sp.]|nr:ABC transporter permease [Alistipes sp.]
MNVFHKVTLQSLKKNRTRTIVTIVGIILSTAMISAVTTFVSSIQSYLLKGAVYNDGEWHGSDRDGDYAGYQRISASDRVEGAVYMQQVGYAYAKGCVNEYKPYLLVLGASNGAEDMLSVHVTAGAYPVSSDEILLPEHLASNGGVLYRIGDTVTLELGDRVSDGYILNQKNPLILQEDDENVTVKEELAVRESRTYTVVGFYERLQYRIEGYDAPAYTAITAADTVPSDGFRYDIYFKMKDPKETFSFMADNKCTGETNADVLIFSGASRYDGFYHMLYGLAAIVIALIMFGSISLIYNAFSISVSERTKQFGLLSAVGATKRQLRKMVFFEAFTVALVGIPLGIGAGVLGIGTTLFLIGNEFKSFGYGTTPVKIELSVSVFSLLTAVFVAFITVLISAWIPSRRATKVSAVEAVRQSMDIKAERRAVRTSKFTYKLFGLPGVLAGKYFKRNRRKYRTTVMSLFMSIVLFVSASAFVDYLMETSAGGFGTNGYDLSFVLYEDEFGDKTPDDVLDLCFLDKNIEKAAYDRSNYFSGNISVKYLNEGVLEEKNGFAPVSGYLHFISDDEFRKLLKQYDLDEEKFMNPEAPLGITIDGKIAFDPSREKYVRTNILNCDECEIECLGNQEEENPVHYTIKSGKTIYEYPFYIALTTYTNFAVIYPIGLYNAVVPEEIAELFRSYAYYMVSEDHAASYDSMKKTLTENGLGSRLLSDYAAVVEGRRNRITVIRVFSYGFIVLISLIAAANVFNTISTNISLRRREFAMLKSVGMTEGGLNKMMNFECLLYGSKALFFGLPVSGAVTYLIYRVVLNGYETRFRLPWGAVGIAVLSVFAVVFSTMMYSMRKIQSDNLIDVLKNENI